MIELNNWAGMAVNKLEEEKMSVTGQKERAMASAVAGMLTGFCRQEEEFAQAVANGGSFPECMRAVAKGVDTAISDLDAYKKAVEFYFPGAKIRAQMTIDLIGDAALSRPQEQTARQEMLVLDMGLNLADFF